MLFLSKFVIPIYMKVVSLNKMDNFLKKNKMDNFPKGRILSV
jgi:hypothetical protein